MEGLVGGKIELVGFVGRQWVGFVLPVAGPVLEDFLDDFGNGAVGIEGGAKVECRGGSGGREDGGN